MDENACAWLGICQRDARHMRICDNDRTGGISYGPILPELRPKRITALWNSPSALLDQISRSDALAHIAAETGGRLPLTIHLVCIVGAHARVLLLNVETCNQQFPSMPDYRHSAHSFQ